MAIESATDWLSIALLDGDEVVLMLQAEGTRQHASALMPLIDRGLSEVDWSIDDVQALAVSTGPGSFTSLRIGLATAKGLAFGRNWPAVSVSTLEAMALSVLEGDSAGITTGEGQGMLVLLDARRGQWYAGGWVRGAGSGGALKPILAEGLYAPEHLVADLGRDVVVVTPDRGDWRGEFERAGLRFVATLEGEHARPRADWVGRLGARCLARGDGGPASELAARYLRRAEAEAQRLGGPVEAGEVARVEGPEG
ncbi:MAG: tRNA (adenosine(37)-N6)-threonylcarbamoyltransferase complex dimerization subunit type 1 TsaB [bacterium]|nr:tRNA (adenosine(37)-N6)-threonylcarbamoyltransferase complex dimerization subunit type 1 TsaB [bacterium]